MSRWIALAALVFSACDGTGGRGTGATNAGSGGDTGGTSASTGGTTGGDVHVNPGQTSSSTGGTTGSDPNCGVQNFTLEHGTIPELLIVQDRSGSMSANPDGSGGFSTKPNPTSKWNQMRTAIEQVVMAQSTIQWGLEMFPEVGKDNDATFGCTVGAPDVGMGPMTGPAIKTALDAASPGGLTPTASAINQAVTSLTQGMVDNNGHPKYILLATDGAPTCSADAAMMGDPTMDAIAAVQNSVASNIHVFVVGIGTDSSTQATLTTLANDGMEPNKTPGQKAYYEVSSTTDLVNVLTKIAGQIVSCNYTLMTAPMTPDLVTIQSGSKTVPRDPNHMNGWDYGPMNMSIVFYGTACSDLQTGIVQSVSAIYGCPPVS